MTCIPSLQSWCIVPSKKDIYKFTKAHQYLQRNPAATKQVIDHDRVFYRHLSFFRIRIISHKNESTSDENMDILSNPSNTENSLITAYDIIDIIKKWNLVDVLDIQEENVSDHSNSFIVIFKTAISAHVMTKLKNFPDLIQKNITLAIESIDPIPENSRVPLVYIQGIGPDVSDDAIRHFFRDMSFILKINRYQKGNIYFHVLKLTSVQNAINLSKQINQGKLTRSNFASFDGISNYSSNNSSQSFIVASHQYKSAITQCFFITSNEKTSLKPEDVHAEVSKFGIIDTLFTRNSNNICEFYIKMDSIFDAKLACGIMNNRMFDNVTLKAVFISPDYFNDLSSEFKQEDQPDSDKSIHQNETPQLQQFQSEFYQVEQDQYPQQFQIQQKVEIHHNHAFSQDFDVLQNQPLYDDHPNEEFSHENNQPPEFSENQEILKDQSYQENSQNFEETQNQENPQNSEIIQNHEIIENQPDQSVSQNFEETQNQENHQNPEIIQNHEIIENQPDQSVSQNQEETQN